MADICFYLYCSSSYRWRYCWLSYVVYGWWVLNLMVALVIGSARCVFDDLREASVLFTPTIIIGINQIAIEIPNINHWVTKHPQNMKDWLEQRRNKGFSDPTLWTSSDRKGFHDGIEGHHIPCNGGPSAMLAVEVALHLGEQKIVLAGCPMQKEQGHFNTGKTYWVEADKYRKFWRFNPKLETHVRSLSGWTKEILGAPTKEWLSYLNLGLQITVKP